MNLAFKDVRMKESKGITKKKHKRTPHVYKNKLKTLGASEGVNFGATGPARPLTTKVAIYLHF